MMWTFKSVTGRTITVQASTELEARHRAMVAMYGKPLVLGKMGTATIPNRGPTVIDVPLGWGLELVRMEEGE